MGRALRAVLEVDRHKRLKLQLIDFNVI